MQAWSSAWASDAATEIARQVSTKGRGPETFVQLRARALGWVGQLDGEGRADRIRSCGWMELMFNPRTHGVGWRNRWCRDRACPACAKRRATKLRHQLRAHLEERERDPEHGRLMFVTLTHPKRRDVDEGPGAAVTRLLAEWRKLSNRRPFKAAVLGYVRATEVTYSQRGYSGWHAHLHLVLEVQRDLRPSDVQRLITALWSEIADADRNAQNFQPLTSDRLGQVVKYITKPFELPDALAPTFFDEMKGRKLISGSGTWRDYAKHDADFEAAPGWIPQGSHVAELVDAAADETRSWVFRWLERDDGVPRPVCPWRDPEPDEAVRCVSMPVRAAWLALARDPRPVQVRSKATRSGALDPGEAPAALRQQREVGASVAAPAEGARAGP